MQFSQRFSGHSKMYNTYHSRENQISIDGISTSLSYSIPYFPSFKMCLFVLDFTQGLNYKLLFSVSENISKSTYFLLYPNYDLSKSEDLVFYFNILFWPYVGKNYFYLEGRMLSKGQHKINYIKQKMSIIPFHHNNPLSYET